MRLVKDSFSEKEGKKFLEASDFKERTEFD